MKKYEDTFQAQAENCRKALNDFIDALGIKKPMYKCLDFIENLLNNFQRRK
jgi:hypothetical protein